jgi:signal peptidase I
MKRGARLVAVFWLLGVGGAVTAIGVAWLADWRLQIVESPSMSPMVPQDSLAVVGPVTPRQIQKSDVIVFRDPGKRQRRLLHRVTGVVTQPSGLFFRTQGDANATADPLLVPDDDVQARLLWHVPKLGAAARLLRPPLGIVILVAVPATSLVVSELRRRRRRRADRPRSEIVIPAPGLRGAQVPYSRNRDEFFAELWATTEAMSSNVNR